MAIGPSPHVKFVHQGPIATRSILQVLRGYNGNGLFNEMESFTLSRRLVALNRECWGGGGMLISGVRQEKKAV